MRRPWRIALRLAAALIAALVILAGAGWLVLRSAWFHEQIRQRIIAELERVTGGTATLGNFAINWGLLTVEFRDLTLHGTEPAGAAPLLEADSIVVGLKIISLWKKEVDIQSVAVREPRVDVIVAADGSTNIPSPKIPRRPGGSGLEPLLDWKIARFSLENGEMRFADRKTSLDLKGENLHAVFSYDFTGPRYQGQISIQPLHISARELEPLRADVYADLGLEKNRIVVSKAKVDFERSYLEASGSIENLSAPTGTFGFTAHVAVDQAARLLKIRAARQGTVELAGSASYNGASDYSVAATVKAHGVEVRQDGIHVSGIRMSSNAKWNPRGLTLGALVVDALGGRFTGKAELPGLQRFIVDGAVKDFAIQRTLATLAPQLPERQKTMWSGVASGPVHLEGRLSGVAIMARAKITIAPATGGIPLSGSIEAGYDATRGTLSLGQSHISTPGMELDLAGTLGSQLQVRLDSTNLDELLPAINAFSAEPVSALPVELKGGNAAFAGAVSGPLSAPQISGTLEVTNFVYSGVSFDRFAGRVTLDESSAQLESGTLARGPAQAQFAGSLSLVNWKPGPSSALAANAKLRGAEISELLKLAGEKQIPVNGALAATVHASGTLGDPHAAADFTVTKGSAYDQPFDRLQASADYSRQAIKLTQAKVTAGPAQVTASATFLPEPDPRNGRVEFQVATNDVAVQKIETVKRLRPDVSGVARASLAGSASIHEAGRQIALTSLDGDISTRDMRLENRPIGNTKIAVKTEAQVLHVQLDSNFLNSNLQASGQWRLIPGYPGEASAHFSQISIGAVRQWLNSSGNQPASNFDGSVEGKVSFSGPALEPKQWKASAEISKLEVFPVAQGKRPLEAERFTARNQGPVALTLANGRVNVESAHFSGPSTDVKISGGIALEPNVSLDLHANGDVDLTVLKNFDEDLNTSGTVTANASIRGPLDHPQVNGQLEVKRASLYVADITTGISGASGTILFYGTQAVIQNFAGQMGGGAIKLAGDVGFASGQLSYRVDATARDVRVRYPEGVSTTINADLNWRGSTQRSTLSGLITVLRSGFTPRTDFSSILFQASQPVRTPSARTGPLSGIQFAVRIETAPDISFESDIAQDIEAEGSLRLQGTPYNPVLLGRINITEGQINFFGNKYTINQASITFANPVRIEPVLNMDLETKVQGIDVILTISGPIDKLNLTPRSDPPMQYSEVLALLATGSPPSTEPALAAQQNTPTQSFSQLGASAVIGQVVANPVSSRLQRFFGVSSLKINPQFTGVENNPQARLTLQQQVNKDVTFTYITNLASSNQQIIRVEWALDKRWSVIAIRDENGLFGMDLLFKQRFK